MTDAEAESRLQRVGPNLIAREQPQSVGRALLGRARNPLNFLLLGLAAVSWATGDVRAAIVIVAMVILSVTLAFVREHRSNKAAAALRAMVHTTASARRGGAFMEVPPDTLVPGDIVRLSDIGGNRGLGEVVEQIVGEHPWTTSIWRCRANGTSAT